MNKEELMVAYSNEDFYLTETLYRVLIPMVDNIHAETTCAMSSENGGWERIRNSILKRVMEYDSTIKLWNASKRRHPLFQQLPHTIFYGNDTDHYFRLRRLQIPTEIKMARAEFKNLMKTGKNQAIKPDAENVLVDWNFNLGMRRRLFKALLISSHISPRLALNSKILQATVKHSLQTELLNDIEINANSMGMIDNSEEYRFCEVIRKFQEPTEKLLPLTFTTTYKTSIYAVNSPYVQPARMWDSEPIKGVIAKDAAVELNFVIQNLTTAWTRRFDKLHDFSHEKPIRDVLPENTDLSKVTVKRSSSIRAKTLRGEEEVPNENEDFDQEWKGTRGYFEKVIDVRGLRQRKNAVRETD